MFDLCIFAGTSEGRMLAEALSGTGVSIYVCVATEYGETLIPGADNIEIHAGRLNREEMCELFRREKFQLVVDATHPYAVWVTENIFSAAQMCGVEYHRLVRSRDGYVENAVYVESIQDAAAYLKDTEGNILSTTGSKELLPYTQITDYADRLFVRVLPMQASLEACEQAGIKPAHIIAMQGPFDQELNRALLRMTDAKYMVTKDSGLSGGFAEKILAAQAENVKLVIIGRPSQINGMEYEEMLTFLIQRFAVDLRRKVSLVGIGMGDTACLTQKAAEVLKQADCIIGAKRAVDAVAAGRPCFYSMDNGKILEYIQDHPQYRRIAVVMTGDVGFYSGTKKLLPLLKEYEPEVCPGISSLQYLCAKVGTAWDDVKVLSLHGRSGSAVPAVAAHHKVFLLVGGAGGVRHVLEELCGNDLEKVSVIVGERLSYSEERLLAGTAEELVNESFDPLAVLLIINPNAHQVRHCASLPDEAFIRSVNGESNVPMTKAEVRAVSVAKLMLEQNSVVYDIGAGTGSVSVEMAGICTDGHVYAVECKPEAAALAERNKKKFGLYNLTVIEGTAPEDCEVLPVPTHAFIGGSSGNMYEILQMLLAKNPNIRIVINVIALESIAETIRCLKAFEFEETEVVQVSVAKARKLGRYHLMNGQNPIMVITCQKHKD